MTESKEIERALFEVARELENPQTRTAFLDRACGTDSGLRQRLERLLRLEETAKDFFRVSPVHAIATETALPERLTATTYPKPDPGLPAESANVMVGRYRILERLGEGGCGVVYLAEQQLPVRRKVALKVIRLGMDTERVIARFEMERQALAMMNHPNIAHVLDAGATESGRPYFVMELVSGVKITQFCDQQRLELNDRLELFVQVCLAIQHAHQKGILHRDIKPSNVIVTVRDGEAVPKVIDFGIAKAVEGPLAEGTETDAGQFIGTPAYMSPEQAATNNQDADTRSDIYSLGALLYELLTGRPPFDSKELVQKGVDEMRRILGNVDPPSPSRLLQSIAPADLVLEASRRQLEAPKLIARLGGDLDSIVMKALEKDRQRRYATANGLASDIRRYLEGEPVAAQAPTRLYRLRKLVRRNRTTFASISAVALALILGLGTSTWLFFEERAARQRETRLYADAEKSEKISRAAFLLTREHKFKEANDLLVEVGTPPLRPSLDGVSAYRAVGEWLFSQGRSAEAAERFRCAILLGKLDVWGQVTLDYQAVGALLVDAQMLDRFEAFRRQAVADYAQEKNDDAVGRILKTCLLRPLDSALMEKLRPMGESAERWYNSQGPHPERSWAAMPVLIWWYRKGELSPTSELARRAEEGTEGTGARGAAAHAIRAMAEFRLGNPLEASRELALGEALIPEGVRSGDSNRGYWYDYLFAKVLAREARALIAGKANP